MRGRELGGHTPKTFKARKKEFLNRYTRRMWNLRVRYVIASKGQNDFTPPISPHQWGRTLEFLCSLYLGNAATSGTIENVRASSARTEAFTMASDRQSTAWMK